MPGGRVVLELVSADAAAIIYDAALHTDASVHRARAQMTADAGIVTWEAFAPPEPPPWLVDLAVAFLRGEWRARRGEDPPPWPARINRWREERRTEVS